MSSAVPAIIEVGLDIIEPKDDVAKHPIFVGDPNRRDGGTQTKKVHLNPKAVCQPETLVSRGLCFPRR